MLKRQYIENNSQGFNFEAEMFQHVDALYSKALKFTKNEGDAEDLVQDTFLKAYVGLDKFKKGTNARAWLFTILTNNFINKFRRKKKEREILGAEDIRVVRENFHDMRNIELKQNPESLAVHNSISVETRTALNKLSKDFRLVVLLADLNDFSYKEIAAMLDCPVGTVMSRLFRGRTLLREELGQYASAEGIVKMAQKKVEYLDVSKSEKSC